jgi:FkbM family methyltransferase
LKFLRRIIIPLLKVTAFDFSLTHHWVPSAKFRLNSFLHKGYWYNGRHREEKTMQVFEHLVKPGMIVAEVGGHIGYISMLFSKLVGTSGKVTVFEPGLNNLPYTRQNLKAFGNVVLVEKGVAAKDGTLTFLEESLSGQNNTFATDFEGVAVNQKQAHVEVSVKQREVAVVALDSYFKTETPDFIKIDVEGFEYEVLLGGIDLMRRKTMWMVEVQSHRDEIYKLLTGHGYVLFNESLQQLKSPDGLKYNTFCLHAEKHASTLQNLGLVPVRAA